MDSFEYIKNSIYIRLKPSPIAGIGLFAIKDIPKDTYLFDEWTGPTGSYPISQSQLETLDYELKQQILDFFTYSIEFPSDTNIYIKLINGFHWIYTNPYYFINSGFYENKSNVDKETMKTLRLVKKGEELLSNYSRYDKFNKSLL
jgi:hypothetical protein